MFNYFIENIGQIAALTIEHIEMTTIAVGIAILVGIPLGILISYVKKIDKFIIGMANIVQAIPSLALLGLAIPLLGIGALPAIVMVIIYSLLPIIKNTYTGISSVDPQTVEAARALGLTRWQVLSKVKMPLGLPVIMAGIRISAVTAVGTMTMAAFIGAGGLGYLVFAGIRTVNNGQILAGAIPACILALMVDYIMGLVEKVVTPVSLQANFRTNYTKRRQLYRKIILFVVAIFLIATTAVSLISGMSKPTHSITVGGKDFTEQFVLVNLYSDYIEDKTNIKVIRKENLGGSQVCYEALKSGDIGMYVDYTGTLYSNILGYSEPNSLDDIYAIAKRDIYKKDKILVMGQCNFNNTYTLAIRKDTAQKYGLKTIADMANVANKLRLGSTIEFQNRPDAIGSLREKFPGIAFKEQYALDGSPRFTAIENNEVDVIDAFGTDGMLRKYDLYILKDTNNVFPPYVAVPMFNERILAKYPELEDVVNELASHLTNESMMSMNYEVDVLGRQPKEVAHEFLLKNKLIKR